MFNAGREYSKHIFWEINRSIFTGNVKEEIFSETINHVDELGNDVKDYWRESPWFEQFDGEEARHTLRKYRRLVDLLGPEPAGMARGSNPVCDRYVHAVRARERELREYGIDPWY